MFTLCCAKILRKSAFKLGPPLISSTYPSLRPYSFHVRFVINRWGHLFAHSQEQADNNTIILRTTYLQVATWFDFGV
jgi:hypothetical protein